jgi:peptidoglycan L-alanyl-D-glutamate endopeptidase CwlK
MVATVKRAIELTKVDFGVTYGVRTLAEQEKLYASGRSQTMKSKHLIQDSGYSHAVDLVAYDGSDVVWELNVYDDIADAMAEAANEVGCAIKWGAAWSVGDITRYVGTMEDAMNEDLKFEMKHPEWGRFVSVSSDLPFEKTEVDFSKRVEFRVHGEYDKNHGLMD